MGRVLIPHTTAYSSFLPSPLSFSLSFSLPLPLLPLLHSPSSSLSLPSLSLFLLPLHLFLLLSLTRCSVLPKHYISDQDQRKHFQLACNISTFETNHYPPSDHKYTYVSICLSCLFVCLSVSFFLFTHLLVCTLVHASFPHIISYLLSFLPAPSPPSSLPSLLLPLQ